MVEYCNYLKGRLILYIFVCTIQNVEIHNKTETDTLFSHSIEAANTVRVLKGLISYIFFFPQDLAKNEFKKYFPLPVHHILHPGKTSATCSEPLGFGS